MHGTTCASLPKAPAPLLNSAGKVSKNTQNAEPFAEFSKNDFIGSQSLNGSRQNSLDLFAGF